LDSEITQEFDETKVALDAIYNKLHSGFINEQHFKSDPKVAPTQE
jgi:hypothetical protein